MIKVCKSLPAVFLVFFLLASGANQVRADQSAVSLKAPAPPPRGRIYHGVFPGCVNCDEEDSTPRDLREYEKAAGKRAAWVYFSNNWYRSRRFPTAKCRWIRRQGAMPYVRLMMRSTPEQLKREKVYTLDRIIKGYFDKDLRSWARGAKRFGSPMLAEYGVEANGEWFPWNGRWNGAGRKDGYGDPNAYDGPERFRDAYRHIIDICRQEGAHNVAWVYHADCQDWPQRAWNRLEHYYPGHAWIDWLAVSVYGAQTPMVKWWPSFASRLNRAYFRMTRLHPRKPIILAEFGVAHRNPMGSQAKWAERALTHISARRWPRLVGISWWNEAWENDDIREHDTTMRLQDNPALAQVFKKLVGRNKVFLGRMRYTKSRRQ